MCKCGCNTCEIKKPALMLNESLAPRDILSEGLKHHLDAKKPLTEHLYRAGSTNYFNLWAEARSMYSRGILEITHEDDLAVLTETNLGHYGMFEGKKVPLDFPMLDEQGADTSWEDEDGNKITLEDILDMTKNVPQKDYPTEKLAKIVLNWDNNPEEVERIDQVEISKQYPILIMADEAGKIQWILDGNHRAQKALRSKSETIPAKIIKPSMLDAKSKKVLLNVPMLNESLNEYSSEGEGWDDDEIEIERDGNIISVKTSIGDEVRYKGHKGKVVKTEYDGVRVNFPTIGENGMTMHFYYEDLNSKEGYYQAVDESLNEGTYEEGGEDDRKYALLRVEPRNYEDMIDKLQGMNINHNRQSDTVIKVYTDRIPDKVLYNLTHDVWVDKFVLKESKSNYPDFDLDKNVRYQDTVITNGMWRYTDKESGGKGVYRNLMNDQFLGFSSEDLGYFKKHLGSHFDMSESLSEKLKGIDGKACWKGYKLSGTKKKNGKTVDNCIPMEEVLKEKEGVPHYTKEDLKEDKKKNTKKLNKPTRDSSGGKAYKVYVKDPKTGNIKTIRFGSGDLRAKINDKKARNAFAARHKCSTKKDKTKAGYWSCRLPRYAKLLGLKSNFSGFW